MTAALSALAILGLLGAFDTLYYHEWRLRLPETPSAAPELRLHAMRDFAYTIVFSSLAWTTWTGNWIVNVQLRTNLWLLNDLYYTVVPGGSKLYQENTRAQQTSLGNIPAPVAKAQHHSH